MRSPFAIFRTYQKTLMVIVFGMAMIGFVLLGAVQDPTNMPKGLVFITVLAVVGGAGWIAGMPSGKSNEYGAWGVVLGALVAVVLSFVGNQPDYAMISNSGDLTIQQMQDLRQRREIANQFVLEALRQTRDPRDAQQLAPKFVFGFQGNIDEDIVTAELLRREADQLGLRVNDAAVTAFIKKITDNRISAPTFKEIRTRLHVGEPELYNILASELQARMAAEFLYGYNPQDLLGYSPLIPPERYWDLYRRMKVKQRMDVAALPVKDFIDESAEPTPQELAELFDRYKANEPFVTPEGSLEEGRPGFRQPRRVQIGYLEAVFDDFKPQIAAVTDEDIQAFYQENYVQRAEAAAARAAAARATPPTGTGPALPKTLELDLPQTPDDTPASETPASDPPTDDAPKSDAPASEAPASETPASEPPAGDTPAETPAAETPAPDQPADTPAAPEERSSTEPKPDETSLNDEPRDTGLFSVADGEQPAETATTEPAPATTEPAADGKPADAPAAESTAAEESPAATEPPAAAEAPSVTEPPPAAETPAETEPATSASETPPASGAQTPAAGTVPAAPEPNIPLLDDKLRAEIRTQIENARTAELLRKAVTDAARYIDDNIGFHVHVPEDDAERMSPEAAADLLRSYAEQHNLHYAETPHSSYRELQDDEEHPVGASRAADDPNRRPLADSFFQTGAQDTYRPAIGENPVTQSWYVAWKLGERAPYVPLSLDEERVREQVTKTWRELKAREAAKARAEELVNRANAVDQSLTVSLAETTITGKEGGLLLSVSETPDFSWLSTSSALQSNPLFPDPPQIHDPPGVEKAGPEFMRTVFDELSPGEAGVATNMDHSVYYVVRVTSRTPSPDDEEQMNQFREKFLREPVFEHDPLLARFGIERPSPYEYLAVGETMQAEPNWIRGPGGLWERHDARIVERNPAAMAAAQMQ